MALQLDGYFDESERNRQGTEPISIAGYVFKPSGYWTFCRAWKRLLKSGPAPTTHFHMTNLYARSYDRRLDCRRTSGTFGNRDCRSKEQHYPRHLGDVQPIRV